jgi:hypothetical protein
MYDLEGITEEEKKLLDDPGKIEFLMFNPLTLMVKADIAEEKIEEKLKE